MSKPTDTVLNTVAGMSDAESRSELEQRLYEHLQHLAALPADAKATDRARVELDVADTLEALDRKQEAWDIARGCFDTFLQHAAWQDTVEACDVLYRTQLPDAIVALGNGVWLAVTYPILPPTTIKMLHYIVDETPDKSDGGAVAAAVAHYIADIRSADNEHEHDSLTFMTAQVLAQVAKRHRNIEGNDMLNLWMETLELNDPAVILERLALILDTIVADNWWYDRDALRARLPVN